MSYKATFNCTIEKILPCDKYIGVKIIYEGKECGEIIKCTDSNIDGYVNYEAEIYNQKIFNKIILERKKGYSIGGFDKSVGESSNVYYQKEKKE